MFLKLELYCINVCDEFNVFFMFGFVCCICNVCLKVLINSLHMNLFLLTPIQLNHVV